MMHSNRIHPTMILILGAILLGVLPASVTGDELLDPAVHPKFVNPLPIPARIDATEPGAVPRGAASMFDGGYVMNMRETTQWLGLISPSGDSLRTRVWGYGLRGRGKVTTPGPTFVARRDVPVHVTWANRLPGYNYPDGPARPHLLPVDPTVHLADPDRKGVPTVTHLHGGHTESASDGLPEAWFTQDWRETGPHYVKKQYRYDNDQEAATLWYHDHALGITRLNVYAGLAGFYLLRDDNELGLIHDNVLPGSPYEIEIAVQDRMFTDKGELHYPADDPELEPGFMSLPGGPSILPEFFGDFIMVNGVVWPRLDVEARKYRLRFLNGSDSRFFAMEFHDAMMGGNSLPFLQVGTDNGLLPQPVEITRLLLGPGERADLVVDFSGHSEVYLRNFGPDDPFKGFNPDGTLSDGEGGALPPADPATTGQVMKFAVTLPLDGSVPLASVDAGAMLRPSIPDLVQDGATRQLVLFEGLDQYGRLQPLLGTLAEGSLAWFDPITENPMVDDVEVWEVYNATEDAHPIHLHLVSFQIQERESFEGFVEEKPQPEHGGGVGVGGILHVTSLGGNARPPEPNEDGWKDTAVMLPGEVTRVIARFGREGRYVWHCHILSHEDHEMMRPYYVGPLPLPAETLTERVDPRREPGLLINPSHPNPFTASTSIRFSSDREAEVDVAVYDVSGRRVRSLLSEMLFAGDHEVNWDARDDAGRDLPGGVYFSRVSLADRVVSGKILLLR